MGLRLIRYCTAGTGLLSKPIFGGERKKTRPFRASFFSPVVKHDLQGPLLFGMRKGLVGVHDVGQGKVMGDEPFRMKRSGLHAFEEHGSRHGIDQPRSERYVMRPELFHVQINALPENAYIGYVPSGGHYIFAYFKGNGRTDGLYGNIYTPLSRQLHNPFHGRAICPAVNRVGRAYVFCPREPAVIYIDHYYRGRRVELRGKDSREPYGARPDDGHGISGLYLSVQHAAFERGREHIREHHERVLVHPFGNRVKAGVGVGYAHELGLRAVNGVAQNPSAVHAMRVHPPFAELARAVRGDAGYQDLVATLEAGNGFARLLYNAYALMAEHASVSHLRHIALHYMQVSAANGRFQHLHYGVFLILDLRPGPLFPCLLARAVVYESFHGFPPFLMRKKGQKACFRHLTEYRKTPK